MTTTAPVSAFLLRMQRDSSKLLRPGGQGTGASIGSPTGDGSANGKPQRSVSSRLNWLRAGVLGANDGIVSISGLLVGVAAVNPANTGAIALAGAAGIASASLSMAVGEYVSVSTQRDTERELVERERAALARDAHAEEARLASLWEGRGLTRSTAALVAHELSERDAIDAHLRTEFNIDPDDLTNPWAAAISSFIAFLAGSALPFITMLAFAPSVRIAATFVAVLIALALTGWVSAWLGDAPKGRAVTRLLVGGTAAMGLTYTIGHMFGVTGI